MRSDCTSLYIKTSYHHLERSKLIYPRMLLMRITQCAQTALSEIPNCRHNLRSYPLPLTQTSRDYVLNRSTRNLRSASSFVLVAQPTVSSFRCEQSFRTLQSNSKRARTSTLSLTIAICLDSILGFDPAISVDSAHCVHFNRQSHETVNVRRPVGTLESI